MALDGSSITDCSIEARTYLEGNVDELPDLSPAHAVKKLLYQKVTPKNVSQQCIIIEFRVEQALFV